MKTNVLVLTLVALIVISLVGVYHIPFGLRGVFSEGFQDTGSMPENTMPPDNESSMPTPPMPTPPTVNTAVPPAKPAPMNATMPKAPKANVRAPKNKGPMNVTIPEPPSNQATLNANTPKMPEEFQNASPAMNQAMQHKNAVKEGFRTNYAEVSGGAKDSYEPIGAFDGVALPTGNNVSSWRYTSPDEPLLGAPFELGNDSLFMFKNNQCKPSCCGSSLSCSGGCVCTTPDQRQFIAGRGGNRTKPAED